MAQHDYVIDNQAFPATRADLNSVLQAIVSNNSGSSAPSTTFANQIWYDSSANILYIRNEDNDANIPLLQLDQSGDVAATLATIIDVLDKSGTNTAGTDLTIRGGAGTGTGAGGNIILQTANAGSSGSSVNSHATAVTIDDAGNVGIGTTSPAVPLHTKVGTDENFYISSDSGVRIQAINDAANTINTMKIGGDPLIFLGTGGTERMRIDSNGKVAMGTSSADTDASVLSIKGTDPAQIYDGQIIIHGSATSGAADTGAGIGFKGHHGTGNRNLGAIQSLKENATSGNADAYMRFVTRSNSGGLAEAMRIDSSGNLLVGTTDVSQFNNSGASPDTGVVVAGTSYIDISRVGNPMLFLNRCNTKGDLIQLYNDGASIGSIGAATAATTMYISSSQSGGLRFTYQSGSPVILPCDTAGGNLDNSGDLGASSVRFRDVYSAGGVTTTSDQNEKQQIASLTDAEITAAKAISGLFKTFKWNDSVLAKGDNARIHTGHIAQEVQQAMTDAGLDAGNYAFWCSNTWWTHEVEVPAVEAVEAQDAVLDDDGNIVTEAVEAVEAKDAYTRTDYYDTADEAPEGATERTRLGLRYAELLAFVGAATEQRLADIETRLTALEA